MACSPDARWLGYVGKDNVAEIYDTQAGAAPRLKVERAYGLVFSPDNTALVIMAYGAASCWDLPTLTQRWRAEQVEGRSAVTRDGRELVCTGHGIAGFYDMHDGSRTRAVAADGYVQMPYQLAVSPDTSKVAISDSDGCVHVYDVASGAKQTELFGRQLVFSEDGALLVTIDVDAVRIYDARRLCVLASMRDFLKNTMASRRAPTSDGRAVVYAASGLGYAEIAGRGKRAAVGLRAPELGACVDFAWSAADRCYASYADGTVLAWKKPEPQLPALALAREPPVVLPPRYFECRDGKASKFWELTLDDTMHRVRYGKIGSPGQRSTKEFDTPAKARAAAESIVAKKLGEGYVEGRVEPPAGQAEPTPPAKRRAPRTQLAGGQAQAILVAGRIVNRSMERMWRACWQAIEGLVTSWRQRMPDLPLVAMLAPPDPDASESKDDHVGCNEVVIGVLLETATVTEGPVALGSADELRVRLAEAAAALDPRFWYELASVLDASIPESREGYGDELDYWREHNGAALSPVTALHLTTAPFRTWGVVAFGQTERVSPGAKTSSWHWRCKDHRDKAHGAAIVGIAAAKTDGQERYVEALDLGEAAHAERVQKAGELATGAAYWLAASSILG
jgi:predicted DNA-binding WGR domain protein